MAGCLLQPGTMPDEEPTAHAWKAAIFASIQAQPLSGAVRPMAAPKLAAAVLATQTSTACAQRRRQRQLRLGAQLAPLARRLQLRGPTNNRSSGTCRLAGIIAHGDAARQGRSCMALSGTVMLLSSSASISVAAIAQPCRPGCAVS